MVALPTVGGSSGSWGTELNDYILLGHNSDGSHKLGANILDEWDPVADAADTSAALTTLLASHSTIYFPAGYTYKLENINPQNECSLIFAEFADVQGVSGASNIFATSGSKFLVKIRGGEWSNCNSVWTHTGTSGALSECTWEHLVINGVTAAFDFSKADFNTWRNCLFRSSTGRGIYCDGSSQSNGNRIVDCGFNVLTNYAVDLSDGQANRIVGCRFEDVAKAAILADGQGSFKIEDCYFEGNGSATEPAILFSGVQTSDGIVIRNNRFGPGKDVNTERVRFEGLSSGVVEDNNAVIKTGQVFVAINGNSVKMTHLLNNYLNYVPGSGDYDTVLYSQSGTQGIRINPYIGSGGITSGDDVWAETLVNNS